MKSLKLILGLALGTTGLGGTIAFGVANNVAQQNSVAPADAATTNVNIYINTSNWGDGVNNVKFYSWAWKTNEEGKWYDFTKSSDHLYKITVEQSITNFIFFRARSDMSHGWNENVNYWNKTGDLSSGGKDLFTFSEYEYSTGSWGINKDSYIYYISDSKNPTNNRIYSWGYGDQFGSFPGTKITDLGDKEEVQGTLHFDGNEVKIYKIPYSSNYSGFLFAYESSAKSGDKTFVAGNAYTWPDNDDEAAGDALELLLDIENARNNATYKGHPWSVCGISKSDATSFCNRYNSLDSVGKSYVNKTTTYTYTDATFEHQDNISYQLIMDRLSIISGVGVSHSRLINAITKDSNSILLATIIASVVLGSSMLAFLYIKKRKHN